MAFLDVRTSQECASLCAPLRTDAQDREAFAGTGVRSFDVAKRVFERGELSCGETGTDNLNGKRGSKSSSSTNTEFIYLYFFVTHRTI